MKHRFFLFIFLIFALALAACGGADNANYNYADADDAANDTAADEGAYEIEESFDDSSSGGLSGADGAAELDLAPEKITVTERMVIKDANVVMVVEDPAAHMNSIINRVEALGGFVHSTQLYSRYVGSGDEVPVADITVRVPARHFTSMLFAVENGAVEITSKQVTGDDVTFAYRDLESRLRNLEKTATQLEIIMAEAHKTEDVLKVYQELQRVNEEAEIIRGKLNYADDLVAFSTITVNLSAPYVEPVMEVETWNAARIFENAKNKMITAVQVIVGYLIWLVVYLLPVGLMLGVPILVIWWVSKKISARFNKPPAHKKPNHNKPSVLE